jgi:glycosyltransferase involved in cell wall biosynthesis
MDKHIAIITMGVKLGDETMGYTRFLTIAQMLATAGFDVDLITSSFQHWHKQQRDVGSYQYRQYDFNTVFIEEPGYQRNIDLARIRSHHLAALSLRRHFEQSAPYDLVFFEIPPNDVARVATQYALEHGIPAVADVNDLWPEAMRMKLDIPVLSDLLFYPFVRDARFVYRNISAVVGTSDEYAARPFQDRPRDIESLTVYVGNDLAQFDAGAMLDGRAALASDPVAGQVVTDRSFIVSYAGTLGASYDLSTLVQAAALLKQRGRTDIVVLVVGDGPDRQKLESLASSLDANCLFLGYRSYEDMASLLATSDVLVNSLVLKAPQSIINKIPDYLAAAKPIINTGSSPELRELVAGNQVGINIPAEDTGALADAICSLQDDPKLRQQMGANARCLAVTSFDRATSYQPIVDLVTRLTT